MRTMDIIRERIECETPGYAELLLPTYYRSKKEIRKNTYITKMFKNLRKRFKFAGQYEFLSRFAEEMCLFDLELSVESDLTDISEHNLFHSYLRSNMVKTQCGSYQLKEDITDTNLNIFKYYRFPIFDITKNDMTDIARNNNFLSILEETWYCITPINNTIPCGTCNPCRFLLKQGISRKMTIVGKSRYFMSEIYSLVRSKRYIE